MPEDDNRGAMITTPTEQAADVCEVFCSNTDKVRDVQAALPQAEGLGTLFKGLGDETRAKILFSLSLDELCVCDIALVMEMSTQAISHHLRVLRAMRLVKYRREGKLAFYSLDDQHILEIIKQGLNHLQHT